ncbi:MAG TPA: ABC transporter ATP-binding protein [Chloroflexia bacterium]|jgi:oligopeptide transport system ATP-binding protein|nr:ABC transporter ATP-binding protein [Chloroflexia bacterium]
MAALLQVKDLKTQFFTQDGVVNAVNGVTFDLYEEETLGIVGESGSGKSVTALSLMGLIPQPPGKITNGEVLFKGKNLVGLPEDEMRKIRGKEIAMIFQDPMTSLNPVLTISRQIGEALQLHMDMDRAAARKRTIELLKLVGIPSAADRIDDYPHQFSGGMRQRVMIAMALSCNPKLLIADEPTTALDVTIQAQILDLIKRLKREFGTAVMMITHDLGVVAGMCDRVQVMYAGHLVEQASVEQLYADPRHPYTLGLIRSVPRLDEARKERLEPIPGLPPDLVNVPPGCPFYPRCSFHMPVCLEQRPLLRPVDGAHTAACWADIKEAVMTNAS